MTRLSIALTTRGTPSQLHSTLYKLLPLLKSAEVELVIVAQGESASYWEQNARGAKVVRLGMTSVWEARNAAIGSSRGEHILVFDDDAEFFDDASIAVMMDVLRQGASTDVHIFNRGFTLTDGAYVSYNQASSGGLCELVSVLPKTTAWNVAYPRLLLLRIGSTPPIGVGSLHACQSGEDFLLIRRLLSQLDIGRIRYHPEVRITHPCFHGRTNKPLWLCLGYQYGAAYAKLTTRYAASTWVEILIGVVRVSMGALKITCGLSSSLNPRGNGRGAMLSHRILPARVRLTGMMDAVAGRRPRRIEFIKKLASS